MGMENYSTPLPTLILFAEVVLTGVYIVFLRDLISKNVGLLVKLIAIFFLTIFLALLVVSSPAVISDTLGLLILVRFVSFLLMLTILIYNMIKHVDFN